MASHVAKFEKNPRRGNSAILPVTRKIPGVELQRECVVYFLINACLTGFRSSENSQQLSIPCSSSSAKGEEREEKEREKGRWRANTCDLQRPLAVVDAIVSTDDVNNIVGYRAVR